MKLEENRVVTASTNQPLSVPKKVEVINGVAKYSFPSDFGYSYATTNDGESLFISNAEYELVGLIDSVSAVDTDGATWAATMSVSNNVVTFSSEESGIRYYRIEHPLSEFRETMFTIPSLALCTITALNRPMNSLILLARTRILEGHAHFMTCATSVKVAPQDHVMHR